MNAWLERYLRGFAGMAVEPSCGDEEAKLVLELAGAAAHASGARPYAPLAAYLAGQAIAGEAPAQRLTALRRAVEAAAAAGRAGADPLADPPVPR